MNLPESSFPPPPPCPPIKLGGGCHCIDICICDDGPAQWAEAVTRFDQNAEALRPGSQQILYRQMVRGAALYEIAWREEWNANVVNAKADNLSWPYQQLYEAGILAEEANDAEILEAVRKLET